MKLDGKVKGGLAWAGLVVILAVPAADMIFGKPATNTAATAVSADATAAAATPATAPALNPAAATDPIQTASTSGEDPVDKFVKSGKKLPSYISDAAEVQPAGAAAAPATTAPVKVPAIQPAAITPAPATTAVATAPVENPPIPLPRDARPKGTQVAALPAAEEKPLIVDEKKVQQPKQTATKRFPLSDDGVVTSDELEEWDSGSLAEYLERKGLMTESSSRSSGRNYDPDGFFLDDGPNQPRRPRRDLDFFLF